MERQHKYRVAYKTDYHHDREEAGEFWVVSQAFHLQDLQPGGAITQFDFSDGSYLGLDDVDWRELVWQEYTGIKDVNDVEICEGDLIETDRPGYPVFEVYWRTEFGMWFLRAANGHLEFLFGYMGNEHTNKVIGNSCENRNVWEGNG